MTSLCLFSRATALMVALASGLARASPIQFLDSGRTTVDTKTGLEWLDVTETVNRSYLDVSSELSTAGSPLGLEGWRYATRRDFEVLVSNFFDVTYTGGSFSINSDSAVVSFISLFGNTWNVYCAHVACAIDGIEGNSDGFLADVVPYRGLPALEIYQGIVTDPVPDPANPSGIVENQVYRLATTTSWGVGSWLVRGEYLPGNGVSQAMPEPVPLSLLGIGLFGLHLSRRKRTTIARGL